MRIAARHAVRDLLKAVPSPFTGKTSSQNRFRGALPKAEELISGGGMTGGGTGGKGIIWKCRNRHPR